VNVKSSVISALGILFVGCATARVNPYPNAHYAPSNTQNVGLYYNFPPQAYEVIGEVYYSGAPAASWTGAGKLLREEAAKIGGDAVVVQQQDTPYAGTITTPGYVSGSTRGTEMGSYFGSSYVGNYSAQSSYVYSPPTATPLYGKRIVGIVIKFQSTPSANATPMSSLSDRFVKATALITDGELAEDEKDWSTATAKFDAAIDSLREIKSQITVQDPAWLSTDVEERINHCQEHLERLKVKPE
jgi:hypothetical protein